METTLKYVRMSEAAPRITLPATPRANGPYHIEVPTTQHLILVFGHRWTDHAAKFTHPKMLGKFLRLLEFKHYRRGGGKFWTANVGTDLYFAVPSSLVEIALDTGYSYVKARINGVCLTLNVSGGTCNGWTDRVGAVAHVRVGHGIRDLKKIAEVSTPGTELEANGWTFTRENQDECDVLSLRNQVTRLSTDPRVQRIAGLSGDRFKITPPASVPVVAVA